MNDKIKQTLTNRFKGTRVLLLPPHPHHGCIGTIIGIRDTILGPRPVIKLDRPHRGASECFLMNSEHYTCTER